MGLVAELQYFKKEIREMNRKLGQVIELLEMLVEAQYEDSEKDDDDPETE